MPAKKSTKAKKNVTAKKSAEKSVNVEKQDFPEPVEVNNNGFLSGFMKFLIVLAVLDFLAIVGVAFIWIVVKIFT